MTDFRELYNFRDWVLGVAELDDRMVDIEYMVNLYLREKHNIHTMKTCKKCGASVPFDRLICGNPCTEAFDC